MSDLFSPIHLTNGVVIRFIDQSNRYFGDFHRVCVKVVISLPIDFPLPDGMLPENACLEKYLERMGVPSSAVETERKSLIDAFLQTSRSYFEKVDFPQQLLRKIQEQKARPIFLRN